MPAPNAEISAQIAPTPAATAPIPYTLRKIFSSLVMIGLASLSLTCNTYSDTPGTSPSPPPTGPTAPTFPTVRITPTGVNPPEIEIRVGEQVLFINNDTQPHDVAGGPDFEHPDCREIDAVGLLVPGQSRQTAPMPTARACDYHDHSNHSTIFNGRIIIR